MSDNSSTVPSLAGKLTMPSLLASSKLFVGFSPKGFSDSESAKSPTSILDTRPFSVIGHPFFAERSYKKPYCCNENSRGIGLGIIDALTDDKSDKRSFNTCTRMVLFGSQLKLQIPRTESVDPSPHSPIEFGIKNKDSLLALHSPAGSVAEAPPPSSPGLFTGEMELSEDYTCVISHGPNPKKTHIFNNCIVKSCGESTKKSSSFLADESSDYLPENFISFCHACRKYLSQGKDVFVFRGEIAFCSPECCREQEMMIFDDEGAKCFQA